MNMRSFMCHQRKQLVRLIYETFYEKHQRSTQILLFIEELYRKNLNQPEDDSIDNQLRQLKAMLSFTNTDILTQIEMALEQTTIAKTFLQHKSQSSSSSSSSSATSSVHFKEEKTKGKSSQGYITLESDHDHWDRDNDHSHEEVGCKPQLDKVHKKILPDNGNGYSKGIELSNSHLVQISSRLRNMGNKIKEEETMIKLEDQNSESLEKLSSSSHYSGDEEEEEEDEEQEEGSQTFNIHQEKKYQEYLQQLLDIQEKHGLKPTPNFVDKNFFFLRSKSQRSRIKPLLKPADRAYIIKLVSLLDVKQDAVRILKVSRNLINTIINGGKRGSQSSQSHQQQQQLIDSRVEEQKEKDIHEERYKMNAYEKELQRSSSSASMSALKKRGRPSKDKY